MDRTTFDRWLDAYKRAWEDRDPEAAADLFTGGCELPGDPFSEPSGEGDGELPGLLVRRDALPEGHRVYYEILATTETPASPIGHGAYEAHFRIPRSSSTASSW